MIQTKNRLLDLKMPSQTSSQDIRNYQVKNDEHEPEAYRKLYNGPIGNLLRKYLYINESLREIENHLRQMKSMVTAEHINKFNQKEFNKIRGESIKIGNDIIKKFKKLESRLPRENDFTTLSRMKRSLYYGFFQQYIILWTNNEQFLRDFEEKLKQKLKNQSQILNCNLTDEDIEKLIENKNTNLFMSNILQDTETVRRTMQEIQDRFDDLKKLEKSITEVHNLFLSLQTLVAEQGDSIQRIENHFNNARDYVEEATKDIKQVAKQMKKSKCCKLKCFF